MTKTVCDRCGNDSEPNYRLFLHDKDGHELHAPGMVRISGERIPAVETPLDLCGSCVESFFTWARTP